VTVCAPVDVAVHHGCFARHLARLHRAVPAAGGGVRGLAVDRVALDRTRNRAGTRAARKRRAVLLNRETLINLVLIWKTLLCQLGDPFAAQIRSALAGGASDR